MDDITVYGHCEAKCEHETRCLVLSDYDIKDIKRSGVYILDSSITDTLGTGATVPLTKSIMLVDKDNSDNTKTYQTIINKDFHYCRTLTTNGNTTTSSAWVTKQVISMQVSSTAPAVVEGGIWLKPSS